MDWDKYAHQYKVLKEPEVHYVDAAEIGRRLFILPGEVSLSSEGLKGLSFPIR